jgi:hypothetical protein
MNRIVIENSRKEDPGKETGEATPELKTEGPLSEKDEQSQAITGNQALQEDAMKIWNARKVRKPMPGAKKN